MVLHKTSFMEFKENSDFATASDFLMFLLIPDAIFRQSSPS